MAKPLKIVLGVIGALLLLAVVAAIALPLLFDPNQFRTQISEVVKEKTGREFSVGDIQLHVFPWLRVGVADATLGNAPGAGDKPFAVVKELGVGVKILPLILDRSIQVSSVKLDGLQLNLSRNAQGVGNWEDLAPKADAKAEQAPADKGGEPAFDLASIDIGGVAISNAAISFRDEQAHKAYRVDPLNLEIGALRAGKPFDVDLSLSATSDAPKASADLTLTSTVEPDAAFKVVTLKDTRVGYKLDADEQGISADGTLTAQIGADLAEQLFTIAGLSLDTTASGKSIPGGKQQLKLSGDVRLDLDKGTLAFDNGHAEAAGVKLSTQIRGSGLTGDKPSLSGPIEIAPFSPRKLLAALDIPLETTDPEALSSLSLKTEYSGSFTTAALKNIALKLDQTSVSGQLAVTDFSTQALQFALKADTLDADRYLPPPAKGESAGKSSGDKQDINDIEIPSQVLDKLNANGTLDVAALTLHGMKLTDVRLRVSGSGKGPKTQQLTAKLYGGKVDLSNRYSSGATPAYALKTSLDALSAAPFLKDLIGKDYVSGLANLDLNLTSSGHTVGDLRKSLSGTVAASAKNGAVKGFNLGETLRKAQATLRGEPAPSSNEPVETDFTEMSVSGRITNGILKTDDLSAASPAFRVSGAGQIDLVNETLNYLAKPTVVGTATGQNGKALENLRGVTIPIKLTGALTSPKVKLDLASALRSRAKSELQDKLGEKLGVSKDQAPEQQLKEKAAQKLNEFLFGRKKKEPAPEPAPGQ